MTEEGSGDDENPAEKGFMFGDTSDESADEPEDTELSFEEPETEAGPEGDDGPDHDEPRPADADSHEGTGTEPAIPGTDLEVASSETDLEPAPSEADLESGDRGGDERTKTDGPLGDLADRVREREGDEEFDDLFDRHDVEGIDREELWEQVEGTADPLEDIDVEREIREIPKGKYCHQCEHFSSPPEVACHNEGTDILELVDLETFRVADCPVVLKNERLEED